MWPYFNSAYVLGVLTVFSATVFGIKIFDQFSMPSIIFTQLEKNLPSNWSITLQYSNLFLSFVTFLCQKTFIYLASHIFIDGFHIYTLDIWHSSHLLTWDDQLFSGGFRSGPVVQLHHTIWEMPNFYYTFWRFHGINPIGTRHLNHSVPNHCTLEYLINVQDVIIMQAWKFSKNNESAGSNKTMLVVIVQKSIIK